MKKFIAFCLFGLFMAIGLVSFAVPIKSETSQGDHSPFDMVFDNDVVVPTVSPLYGKPSIVYAKDDLLTGNTKSVNPIANSPPSLYLRWHKYNYRCS